MHLFIAHQPFETIPLALLLFTYDRHFYVHPWMYIQYHPSNDSPSSTDRLISDTAFNPPSIRVAHPKVVVSGSRKHWRLPARRTTAGRGTGFCAHWLLV